MRKLFVSGAAGHILAPGVANAIPILDGEAVAAAR